MFELMPFTYPHRHRAISAFDPFREFDELERAFFGAPEDKPVRAFNTDISDKGDSYLIETDLPGFRKEDICIDISEGTMTVAAERHSDYEDKDKKDSYVRVERSYGAYRRSYDISGIKADDIKAKYENGVLAITLPKKEEVKPETRRLDIA